MYHNEKYLVAVVMYKYRHSDLHEVFKDMYITNDTIHPYSTWQENRYHLPLCSPLKNIRYCGAAIIWNELPSEIEYIFYIYQFKNDLHPRFYEEDSTSQWFFRTEKGIQD